MVLATKQKNKIVNYTENYMLNLSVRFKIDLGYQCNNDCRFCINSEKRTLPPKTTEEVKKEIILARQNNIISLELLGGEPTIRPDIIEIIKFATKMRFRRILLETNGRMLSHPNFARKIVEADPLNIMFSIHGHNAKTHDFLTRAPGSFYQLMKGLENLRRLNFQKLTSNTIVTKYNFRYLFQIGKLISAKNIKESIFSFPKCSKIDGGGAYSNFQKIVPRLSQVVPILRKFLLASKKQDNKWMLRYFPFCFFPDFLDHITELHELELKKDPCSKIFSDLRQHESGKIKTEKCKRCKLQNLCYGLFDKYYEEYGDAEIKPII